MERLVRSWSTCSGATSSPLHRLLMEECLLSLHTNPARPPSSQSFCYIFRLVDLSSWGKYFSVGSIILEGLITLFKEKYSSADGQYTDNLQCDRRTFIERL